MHAFMSHVCTYILLSFSYHLTIPYLSSPTNSVRYDSRYTKRVRERDREAEPYL
ncbi:hypothetical protein BDV41DRAFT_535005 [Aspergillus transmontanensis]|uniref:Uncharacterized protein n=1 Tax=Aspergillus transmontanensis TaxID=1034304 RepID=A0A5N6W2B5_9EURO|nr:hypothetical protein BDV41DRAFT_535005 [Aspergillus transmontanensis]